MKKIIIAIDGFSACGKSTLAKALSEQLRYAYVDTGAMYRAVTLYLIENQIDIQNKEAIRTALERIHIHFENVDGKNHTFLNDRNVEEEIRSPEVSAFVSPVAAISEVRRAMVLHQKAMGKRKGLVMDGRDIGTVVFPDAELKIFLTARQDVRTQRRLDEFRAKNIPTDFEAVQKNLQDRDHIDSTRADSPLRQAQNAVLIDNSDLSPTQQLATVLDLIAKI